MRFIPAEVASRNCSITDVLVLVVAERVIASGGDDGGIIKGDGGYRGGRRRSDWSALVGSRRDKGCQ